MGRQAQVRNCGRGGQGQPLQSGAARKSHRLTDHRPRSMLLSMPSSSTQNFLSRLLHRHEPTQFIADRRGHRLRTPPERAPPERAPPAGLLAEERGLDAGAAGVGDLALAYAEVPGEVSRLRDASVEEREAIEGWEGWEDSEKSPNSCSSDGLEKEDRVAPVGAAAATAIRSPFTAPL
jgi:hypothetical protein